MTNIPDPNAVFPNEYKTSCFIKNVVTAPNITVGDYTYYDDAVDPTGFERNNVLFNYPEFGDHLMIGKFVRSRPARSSSWVRRTTASAALRRTPSTSSAARGRRIPCRTWRSFRTRATRSSETTCGSGARASSCLV